MKLRRSNPETVAPPVAGAYSHVARIESADLVQLHVSGQLPLDRDGSLVGAGDMRAQAQQVFENLRQILVAEGATFDDVVKVSAFVTDMTEIATIREVRARFVGAEPPASTMVQVAGLALPDALIEIELIAAFPAA